jgi:hypothetical protein
MRTLRLASPYMRGDDVRAAQRVLMRRGYLPASAVDGVYGPVTANAAKRAKWDIGYKRGNVNATYGRVLHAYLSGARKPSRVMNVRARARRRKPADATIGAKAAATMTTWAANGWKEYPAGSNVVPQLVTAGKRLGVGAYYFNMRYPWCAYATFLAALEHGSVAARDGFAGRFNVLYTPTIRQVAENGSYGCRAVPRSAIQRGTFVLFDFGGSNGGEVDHIGIALAAPGQPVTAAGRRWTPSADQVVCAEGNTSLEGKPGSQANGGACAIRIRPVAQIRTPFEIR